MADLNYNFGPVELLPSVEHKGLEPVILYCIFFRSSLTMLGHSVRLIVGQWPATFKWHLPFGNGTVCASGT